MSQTIDETTLLNNSNNYWELVRRYKQLQQENQRLKENNMSMQEEMARTWEKADLYKEVIEEVREYIKECSSREISLDILEILDKVKVD